VTFAGLLLLIVAAVNTIYGIAAIGKAHVFVNDARYVFGDLNLWGWFVLALGVAQFVAALAVWRGAPWARWFAVACVCGNGFLQMLWLPAFPLLAISILTLDVIALYGLLMYGGHRRAFREAAEREKVLSAH
jgi:hypothetical protein